MVVLHGVLDVGLRILAGLLRAAHDVLGQFVVIDGDLFGVGDFVEHELGDERVTDTLVEVGIELVDRLFFGFEILLECQSGITELLLDLFATGGDLVADGAVGQGRVDLIEDLLEDGVAGFAGLLDALATGHTFGDIGAKFFDRVEFGGGLRELVVEFGELLFLDVGDLDVNLDIFAGEFAADKLGREGLGLTGLETGDGLVEALEHGRLADLVGHSLSLGGFDLFAVLGGRQVDRDEVAVNSGAVDLVESCETLAQCGELFVDIFGGDDGVFDSHFDLADIGQGDLGAYVDLGGDFDVFAVNKLGKINFGLAQRLDLGLFERLSVPIRERAVDGLVEDGAAADTLVDYGCGDFALAEAWDRDLRTDGLVCRVKTGLELLKRHLDGELDSRRAQGLGGVFHVVTPA